MGKSKGGSRSKLKPGDEGYLTPTQLRNARKRRAKQQQAREDKKNDGTPAAASKRPRSNNKDPSLQYASNPRSAPIVQAARQFFQSKKSKNFPIVLGATEGWRTVAKLAVRNHPQSSLLTLGLFAPRSHDIIEAFDCSAHHPAINRAAKVLQEQARALEIPAFDEATGRGLLRHAAFAVQRHTGAIQLTLVWNSSTTTSSDDDNDEKQAAQSKRSNSDDVLLEKLWKALVARQSSGKSSSSGVQWQSIWVHYNAEWKHSNAIFSHSGKWKKLFECDSNTTTLCPPSLGGITEYLDANLFPYKVPLHFPPNVFRQANLTAFQKIVQSIRDFLKTQYSTKKSSQKQQRPSRHCLELYGGVGTIGLHVADLCDSLVSSDENPYNVACFEASAKILLEQLQTRNAGKGGVPTIEYKPFSASKMMKMGALSNVDLVIVDPPRKGLEDTVSAALAKPGGPKTLIYVSCGFEAFQRDFEILVTSGGWQLDRAEGHILFPGSNAIETLAIFTR